MTDESPMPISGQFFGWKMKDVPAWYLVSLIRGGNCYGELEAYLEDNEDVITKEYENKS